MNFVFDLKTHFETWNGLQFSKIVKLNIIKVEGEASSMAGVLTIHKQLMNFLYKLQAANLQNIGRISPHGSFNTGYCVHMRVDISKYWDENSRRRLTRQ
jgi:hypothetical protein